ncbi:PilZ domain-containing protein [Novosphingobium guangzhouense]|uniref:Pilus assembly protein PilZ n=1 Tax=Novosphingobium guangzhouense TaxID=1850347 RepID=A0A2K2FZ83_9SPHN|nr:PilZ domain-containing protein [Novosphingobium guangzhouense]PNU04099.1 pilus assembly protein PilZ [Novosphingobium guangzhouense]
MSFPESLSGGRKQSYEEQRASPRFALLLRASKLIGVHGEYLCIVRDVSETGVKLRLFHALATERRLALESAAGDRITVEKMWETDGEAGFRFEDPIDVQRFIAEAGPYPKRPIRICVDHEAHVTIAGETAFAKVRDLSRQGAGIETDHYLAIGQHLRIASSMMPEFEATVCWRQHPSYGIVFRQLMSLEELAVRAFHMQEANAR